MPPSITRARSPSLGWRDARPLLDEPQFRAAFEAHPPYQRLLEAIPTLLITCEEPGLIGCAAVAKEQATA